MQELLTVLKNEEIADGVFKIILHYTRDVEICGGQFAHVAIKDGAKLLRRPICICDYDTREKTITLVYALIGDGTTQLSKVAKGEQLDVLFPLGKGFDAKDFTKIALVGGGMGAAVLPSIATTFKDKKFYSYIGFSDKSKVILEEELQEKSLKTTVCTDNGTYGEKGFVTDALFKDMKVIPFDAIFCCGPQIMYKTLKNVSQDIPVFASLEQRMGCGIGACLVCSCKIKRNGSDEYLRVCADGPVFDLNEVVL